MEIAEQSLTMQDVYAPISSYQSIYKQKHHENAQSFFKEMAQKSEVDIDANRATMQELAENDGKTADNNKLIRNQRILQFFAIILLIGSVVSIILSATKMSSSSSLGINIGVIVLAIAIIVLSIYFIKKTKGKLSELRNIEDKLLEISDRLLAEAAEQMKPLNSLLYKNYNTELFTRTIPLVEFDEAFDSKRLDYLTNKFGFDVKEHEENLEESTVFVQSGEIKGNPFFIRNNLQHSMGTKKYEGSLRIHWTTVEKDSEGNKKTVQHSDTLYAEVEKPCPFYSTSSHIVYGNEVGDRLSFSREPSYIHQQKERKIEREIKKKSKELQKLAEKSTKNGGAFTALANNEFDALFYAKDRDDEAQFRLLFTPLAQNELVKIIKDNEVGFGDDFAFIKRKMINYIYPEHLIDTELNVAEDYFIGIDYDKVEQKFIDYHNKYFKHIYFAFAPLFAVPLYTQHKTQEYIYKDLYDSYVSFYQHEMAANSVDINEIAPSDSVTNNIVKTSIASSQNNVDTLNVHVWGYKTVERTEYVSKYGGDGNWHKVPVNWTEYVVVDRNSVLEVAMSNQSEDNSNEQASNNWVRLGNVSARLLN